MQQETSTRTRVSKQAGKRIGHVVLFVALAVVPVLALNSFATATPSSDGGSDPGARPALTDAQRQCLADQGITLPTRGAADAATPSSTTARRQLRRAAEACGLGGGHARPFARALTDEQRQCLTDHGITLPPTSTESLAALRSAAAACGLPAHGGRGPQPGSSGGAAATI